MGWVVSVKTRPLYPRRRDTLSITQEAEWALGPVYTGAENLAPTGIRSPDRQVRSESLYRLCYQGMKWIKNLRVLNGNRARDIPACSAVLRPIALQRTPLLVQYYMKLRRKKTPLRSSSMRKWNVMQLVPSIPVIEAFLYIKRVSVKKTIFSQHSSLV